MIIKGIWKPVLGSKVQVCSDGVFFIVMIMR